MNVGRKHQLLTALSHAHSRHGGDIGKVLTEIEGMIHGLTNQERSELLEQLVAEVEDAGENQ